MQRGGQFVGAPSVSGCLRVAGSPVNTGPGGSPRRRRPGNGIDGTDGVPDGIVPFAVQLEFYDPAKLKQLISDHLYKARERLFSRR